MPDWCRPVSKLMRRDGSARETADLRRAGQSLIVAGIVIVIVIETAGFLSNIMTRFPDHDQDHVYDHAQTDEKRPSRTTTGRRLRRTLRSAHTMLPTRHSPTSKIRQSYGARVDRLGAMLLEGDSLADATVAVLAGMSRAERDALIDTALDRGMGAIDHPPDALVQLFKQLEHVPFWFNAERANRGGEVLLRSGPLGGLILGLRSLVGAYCSPAGNKPLMFSARLQGDVARRLTETSRFVQLTSMPGGLDRHGSAFRATVKVRLMHAQVRRMLVANPDWHTAEWGEPINQFDMAGTSLLFSLAVVDGLRALGVRVSDTEADDLLHLWRYSSYLMGVREELLCASEREARELWEVLSESQGEPDDDSRMLAKALVENSLELAKTPAERTRAERFVRFAYGLSRYLIGDRYADQLGFPKTAWRFGLPAITALISRADLLRRGMPWGDDLALRAGIRYWEEVVMAGERPRGRSPRDAVTSSGYARRRDQTKTPSRAGRAKRGSIHPSTDRPTDVALLERNRRAGVGELLLDLFGFRLAEAFLDHLGRALDQGLRLAETESGDLAHGLDHVDLVRARRR